MYSLLLCLLVRFTTDLRPRRKAFSLLFFFYCAMDVTDVQQGVGSMDARGGVPNLFHALGPALLISMGYIDLGKWVAAVEAGSRFGFDLVLLALIFNFIAIICQYLAACIGTVTGKNLAEVLVYLCCSLVLLIFY